MKKLIEFSLLRMEATISIPTELQVFATLSDTIVSENKDLRFTDFSVYRDYKNE